MLALANEAQARKADLGDLLAREEGKTLPEAIGEVTRAGNIFSSSREKRCAFRARSYPRCVPVSA